MPLDGLSSSNTGMYRFMTPLENMSQVEQVAKHDYDEVIKKTEKGENLNNNLKKDSEDEKRDLQGRDSSEEESNDSDQIFIEGKEGLKKYKVIFNSATDMVEFVDQKTGFVVETISPSELINIVSKSVKPSGILVDREG